MKVELYRMQRVLSLSGVVFKPKMTGAPTQHEINHAARMVKRARLLLDLAL